MNHVERFRAVMNFQPVDRLPRWEWAMWWDETIRRWHQEGLPVELRFSQVFEIAQHFGLDPYQQYWFSTTDPTIEATQHHVEGIVANMDDYRRIRPQLFPCHDTAIAGIAARAEPQRRGEAVVLQAQGPENFFAVVATAGTTNFGIVDDLDSVAQVCAEYGIWFHVDGANGGAGVGEPHGSGRG